MNVKNILKTRKNKEYPIDIHHLFTKKQVEKELLKVVDAPTTIQERFMLNNIIDLLHNQVPKLTIPRELHRKLHYGEPNWTYEEEEKDDKESI